MIYQISQVSNRDIQLLYFYRILRHSSTNLNELYRYDNPDVFFLDKCEEVIIEDRVMYEYHLSATQVMNRIPYLEFMNEDEEELKHIEDLIEVEVQANELIIRGNTNKLTKNTSVSVYWVPSLQYINKIQKQIEAIIGNLEERYENDKNLIDKINVSSGYVMNVNGLVPNLANIGEDSTGLIYDDSRYRLSGSLSEQLLVNPPQSLISSILKSHTGDLQIRDNLGESKVYQGFYGGRIKLSGKFKTLVLKDITSIVLLSGMSADKIIIENCPAVMFRTDIKAEGKSHTIKRLEVRNSYLTIYQSIVIESIWCYRRSTVVLKKGKITAIGFIEAGSTFVYDTPSSKNSIDIIDAHSLQGLFYTIKPPENKPYLDDIFLSQKAISFQRGQVEDPVPISEAIVHIYLNQRGTPSGGGGTSDGRIYSPFTDWYWSGDSRTDGLIKVVRCAGKGYPSEGLSQLRKITGEIVSGGTQKNILLWWGVNGLNEGYAEVYEQIAQSAGTNSVVFVATVGRVFNTSDKPDSEDTMNQEGGAGSTSIETFNNNIKTFNENLKTALSSYSDIHVLDVWDYIENTLMKEYSQMELAANVGNGLHYSATCYQKIYDWVCSQITNVEPGVNAPMDDSTQLGVFYNAMIAAEPSWTKEIISGIVGNVSAESGFDPFAKNPNGALGLFQALGSFRISTYAALENAGLSGFIRTGINSSGWSAAGCSKEQWKQAVELEIEIARTMSPPWNGNSDASCFSNNLDAPSVKTGEDGAAAYAELWLVTMEKAVNGESALEDPGVIQVRQNYWGSYSNYYQATATRRDRARTFYNTGSV